ncbi:MAG: hypothetical protein LIP12_17495, partial [Clostridiales bacterium]|nr:hypothetical protein [Clostridiales bacterium]
RDAEKANTERERLRADAAEQKVKEAEAENAALMQKLSDTMDKLNDAMDKMQELSQEVANLRKQMNPA